MTFFTLIKRCALGAKLPSPCSSQELVKSTRMWLAPVTVFLASGHSIHSFTIEERRSFWRWEYFHRANNTQPLIAEVDNTSYQLYTQPWRLLLWKFTNISITSSWQRKYKGNELLFNLRVSTEGRSILLCSFAYPDRKESISLWEGLQDTGATLSLSRRVDWATRRVSGSLDLYKRVNH